MDSTSPLAAILLEAVVMPPLLGTCVDQRISLVMKPAMNIGVSLGHLSWKWSWRRAPERLDDHLEKHDLSITDLRIQDLGTRRQECAYPLPFLGSPKDA